MDITPRLTSSRRYLPVLFLLVCFAAPEIAAQTTSPAAQSAAVYRHAQPGQSTMEVKVWGAVRAPGLYQVTRDTDLVTLLALAGGPTQFVDSPTIERTLWIQLTRQREGIRTVLLEMPLDELTRSSESLPAIHDGDILSLDVEATQRFGWRDGLTVFSALGSAALIVLNIIRLSR